MRFATASAMSDGDARSPIFQLLLLCAHRLAVEVTEELEFEHMSAMGLVVVQLLLGPRPPRGLRELAAALGCSRPAATQLVDRLVRDGLVVRTVDPDDGRARRLSLTKDGRAYGGFAQEVLERCMDSFMAQIGAEEQATLHVLLERLERGADWQRGMRLLTAARLTGKRRPRTPAIHIR
jgi:DNA-binding MarR family transcriptional regulator